MSKLALFPETMMELYKQDENFRMQLKNKLEMDYLNDKIQIMESLEPMSYREDFNPTFLFHLDMLVNVHKQKRENDSNIYARLYQRYHFYLCLLTAIGEEILIFIYRIHDDDNTDIHDVINKFMESNETTITFHRVYDATKEIKEVINKNWVSENNSFFVK